MTGSASSSSARIEFREDRCKGCGLCVDTCPRNLLSINGKINAQGYAVAGLTAPERCNGCALCAEMCPDIVIEVWR